MACNCAAYNLVENSYAEPKSVIADYCAERANALSLLACTSYHPGWFTDFRERSTRMRETKITGNYGNAAFFGEMQKLLPKLTTGRHRLLCRPNTVATTGKRSIAPSSSIGALTAFVHHPKERQKRGPACEVYYECDAPPKTQRPVWVVERGRANKRFLFLRSPRAKLDRCRDRAWSDSLAAGVQCALLGW